MNIKLTAGALALAAIGAVSLTGLAAGKDNRGFGPGPGGPPSPERMVAHMTEALGLSTDQAAKITSPMLLFFGDQDPFIPNEEVQKIKDTLTRLNKSAEVVVYPGAPHGFFCNERDSYRPEAAQDSWQRLKTFFAKHLQS